MGSTMQLHGSIHSSTFTFCTSICVPHLALTKFSHNEANATLAQLRATEFVLPTEENTYKFPKRGQEIESSHSSQRHNGTIPKFGNRREVYVRRNLKEATEDSSEQELHKHFWPNEEGEVDLLGSLPWPQRRAAITSIQMTENLSDTLERVGGKLQTQDLNLVLRYFGRMQKWQEVSQLFDWMKRHGKVSAASYTSFITLMGKGRQTRIALELYYNLEDEDIKSNVFVGNSMLKCLISNGRVETAFKLFEQMKEGGLNPDIVTYSMVVLNSLLKVYARSGLFEKARELLAELDASGQALDEELCSSVITGLGETGRAEEASKLYNQLKSNRHTLSKALHEKILNILVSGRMLKEAYTVMKDNAKSISKPCLKKFVIAFAEAGNIYILGDVFKEFHSTGCKIEQGVLNIALSRYIEQGKKRELIRLLKWMKNQRYELASSTLNSVLKKLRESGQSDVAEMLSHEFTSSGKQVMTL